MNLIGKMKKEYEALPGPFQFILGIALFAIACGNLKLFAILFIVYCLFTM